MKKLYLIFYILLLHVCPLYAQTPWTASGRFTEKDGLSSNHVNDIVQDKNGFIWIATQSGLNRFDSNQFKVYRKSYTDTNSLMSNMVQRIAVDSKNRIWIGYGPGGVSCYDQGTGKFRHFRAESTVDGLPNSGIDDLFIDVQDRVWIGVAFEGLFVYEPEKDNIRKVGMLPFVSKDRSLAGQRHYNRISEIEVDSTGLMWMATGDGLYTYDPAHSKFEVYRFASGPEDITKWKRDVFNTICKVGDDGFYLGGWGTGVNYFDIKSRKWKTYLTRPDKKESDVNNIIVSLRPKSEHELWVTGTDTTLCIFNTLSGTFTYIPFDILMAAQLTFNNYSCLYSDKEGNLWIGDQNGFAVLNLQKPELEFIRHPVSYSSNGSNYNITQLFDDETSNSTFLSTDWADGLNRIDATGIITHFEVDRENGNKGAQFLGELFNDSKNRLWVTSASNIYQFDRRQNKLILIPPPTPDTSTKGTPVYYKMTEAPDGNLWIATLRHGIYKLDPNTLKFTQFFHKEDGLSLKGNVVTGLECTRDGILLIGYNLSGLSSFDTRTGKFIHYNHNPNDTTTIIDNRIVCLHTDDKGNIWAGTFSGLICLTTANNKLQVQNFVKGEELLGTIVFSICSDHNGDIWFTESKGLTIYSPANGTIKRLNYTNGLLQNKTLHNISRGRRGQMLLGASNGYYRIPEDIDKTRISPNPVCFIRFNVGQQQINLEQPIRQTTKIRLAPDQNFFNIEFVSLNFRQLGYVEYCYRLKGIENNWSSLTRNGIASYAQLPGGDYIFEVKAKNESGEWSNISALPIFIATPFYKTNAFNILMALLFAGAIFLLYRYRIKTIEKEEALKTRLNKQLAETEMKALRAQMNPHFIFNCLNSINRYIIKNEHKAASLYLTRFAKLIRLILDNSERHEIALEQEIETLKLYIEIEALRFDNQFQVSFKVDPDIMTETIMIPPMLIQPYVENAIWHGLLHKSTPGQLQLQFHLEGDMLKVTIEDNGVGRQAAAAMKSQSAATRKSLGLKITADRLDLMNLQTGLSGSVKIEDLFDSTGNGAGTKVTILIPIEN